MLRGGRSIRGTTGLNKCLRLTLPCILHTLAALSAFRFVLKYHTTTATEWYNILNIQCCIAIPYKNGYRIQFLYIRFLVLNYNCSYYIKIPLLITVEVENTNDDKHR